MVLLRERRRTLPGFVEPCLPTLAKKPPSGPDWIHEIKHDGFRIMGRRDAGGPRLISRNGHDFSERFPFINFAVGALPIEKRKRELARLLKKAPSHIVLNEHFDADGAKVYREACWLGCEGSVSKKLGWHYRSGRSDTWLKIKNPKAPAATRVWEEDWGR
jgi:bifunctional non-homologous end joining protein LigD